MTQISATIPLKKIASLISDQYLEQSIKFREAGLNSEQITELLKIISDQWREQSALFEAKDIIASSGLYAIQTQTTKNKLETLAPLIKAARRTMRNNDLRVGKKINDILSEALPRLVSLASRGLPHERLIESIKSEVKGVLAREQPRFTPENVRNACIKVAGIKAEDFSKRCRKRTLTDTRSMFYYICFKYEIATVMELAKMSGITDHSTVIKGKKKIKELLEASDSAITDFYNDVMQILTTE